MIQKRNEKDKINDGYKKSMILQYVVYHVLTAFSQNKIGAFQLKLTEPNVGKSSRHNTILILTKDCCCISAYGPYAHFGRN